MATRPGSSLLKNIMKYINDPGKVDPDKGLRRLTGNTTPVRKKYRRN